MTRETLEKKLKEAGVPDYKYNLTGKGRNDERLCLEKIRVSGLFITWREVSRQWMGYLTQKMRRVGFCMRDWLVENDREAGFIDEHLYPLACNEGGDYFYWDIRDENVYMLYCDDIENPVWICASVKEFFDLLEYCGEKRVHTAAIGDIWRRSVKSV